MQKIGSEANFSVLYVIIEVPSPPTWNFPLQNTPQFPTSSSSVQYPPPHWNWTQALKKVQEKHSKRQRAGYEEITEGADQEVLSLYHQLGEVVSSLIH